MPYYSAKGARQARQFASTSGTVNDATGQLLTEDRRLHLYEDGRISVRKPRRDRILAAVSGKGLTLLSLWLGGSLALLFGLHHAASQNAAAWSWLLSMGAIYLWWLAGPDDLNLDLRQRTYQYRRGFLYFAPTEQGTFADVSTVGVQPYSNSRRQAQYSLLLIWNVPGRRATNLGEFQTREQADAQRTRLLEALAL